MHIHVCCFIKYPTLKIKSYVFVVVSLFVRFVIVFVAADFFTYFKSTILSYNFKGIAFHFTFNFSTYLSLSSPSLFLSSISGTDGVVCSSIASLFSLFSVFVSSIGPSISSNWLSSCSWRSLWS